MFDNAVTLKIVGLFRHEGFLKYFKNLSWLFFEKILRAIAGLFVGVWVARYLGPENFGALNYVLSLVGLFTVFSTLGLDNIVIRELVKNNQKRDTLLGTAFWLKLFGGLALLVTLFFLINFISQDQQINFFVLIVASGIIFQSFNVIDFYFQSQVLSKYVVYAKTISLFLSSLIKIFLILNKASLIAFVWVVVFDYCILSLGLVYFYFYNKFSIFKWKFNRAIAIDLLRNSWPLILSGLAVSVYMKIDQIMIKEMLNANAVGQYAAAVQISEAWYVIPMMIVGAFFPAIIRAKQLNQEQYQKRLQYLYSLMICLSLSVILPMLFLSSFVIKSLYGVQYIEAIPVLMVHIWAGIFVSLGLASGRWLLSENLQIFMTINTILGALINIILNYVFIPLFGIVGAAWATLIAYLFSGYLMLIFFKQTRASFFHLSKSFLFWRVFYDKNNI